MTGVGSSSRSKVARLIDKYDLEEFGDWIEDAWTDEGDDRQSLRDLTEEFNKRILAETFEEADEYINNIEVEHTYDILTNENISAGNRVEKRKKLERLGIDMDVLETEFITHQALYTYLTKVRGAEYEQKIDTDEAIQRNIDTLRRLQSRTITVTEDTVDRMCDADRDIGEKYDFAVNVTASCRFCGKYYQAVELVKMGGCPCDQ